MSSSLCVGSAEKFAKGWKRSARTAHELNGKAASSEDSIVEGSQYGGE